MKTPHKHAAYIKAWADGALIEERFKEDESWFPFDGVWTDDDCFEYRIKPEPKPDIVMYANVYDMRCSYHYSYKLCGNFNTTKTIYDNLKVTWDGETGKLKAAEAIA